MDVATADAGFLNARQEAFCRNFVAGGSAVTAARAAGYGETGARAQAARLLQHPGIQARIETLRADEDNAKAALCGRLLQDAQHIRETAMEQGDFATALRAVNTTLRLVQTLGMPALPADTHDVLLDGAADDADADANAVPEPGMPTTCANAEVRVDGAAMLADVGECRSVEDAVPDADLADVGECWLVDDVAPDVDPPEGDGQGMLADVGDCRSLDRADGRRVDADRWAAHAGEGQSGSRPDKAGNGDAPRPMPVMDGTARLRPLPGHPRTAGADARQAAE